MIGITNAIEQRVVYNIDNDTWFLMTDTIEDKSHFHSTIQNNGGTTINTTTKRDGRNSIYFNGSSYLKILKNDLCSGAADLTIEYWAMPVTLTGNTGPGTIFNLPGPSNECGIIIGHVSGWPNHLWYSTTGTNWNYWNNWYSTNRAATANTWFHYAFVRQGLTMYQFFNGLIDAQYTSTVSNIITNTNSYALIGAYMQNNNFYPVYQCYIQDFRISRIARYTNTFTPPERLI